MYLLAICIYSSVDSVQLLSPFLKIGLVLLLFSTFELFVHFRHSLPELQLAKIISHSVGCLLTWLNNLFAGQKPFNCIMSHILVIVLISCDWILFRKFFSILYLDMFSIHILWAASEFQDLCKCLGSILSWFLCRERYKVLISLVFLAYGYKVFPEKFVKETVFSTVSLTSLLQIKWL